ncbi:alpha/beta hydrolase [Acinetobacter oleivorans]|uniref:alpha/beta fold hydrolase n=2 Tax=Moraxellaceae TaxID=468 RepID=UPI003A83F355
MSKAIPFEYKTLNLCIEDTEINLSIIQRLTGKDKVILFLHGFGSTKEDYANLVYYDVFNEYDFIAYDAPSFGTSTCSDHEKLSIPFLVETAKALLNSYNLDKFHISGHSMGGLTALLLADELSDKVLSFINIEGNISPEDCFLSRQIISFPEKDPRNFFDKFIERVKVSYDPAAALYAANIKTKVSPSAIKPVFSSMVELSDSETLMTKFLNLPCPKMFMYGITNCHLSYLENIQKKGVKLSEIDFCGHFPMYSNPVQMWNDISTFLSETVSKN